MKGIILITCWLFCSVVVVAQIGTSGPPPRKSMKIQVVELEFIGTNICISFNQEMKNVIVRVSNENGIAICHRMLDASAGSEVIITTGKPGQFLIQVTDSEGILVREWKIEL